MISRTVARSLLVAFVAQSFLWSHGHAAPGVKGGYRRYVQPTTTTEKPYDHRQEQQSSSGQSSQNSLDLKDDASGQSTVQQTSGGYQGNLIGKTDDQSFSQGQIEKLTGESGSPGQTYASQSDIEKLLGVDSEAESGSGSGHSARGQDKLHVDYALLGEINTLDVNHNMNSGLVREDQLSQSSGRFEDSTLEVQTGQHNQVTGSHSHGSQSEKVAHHGTDHSSQGQIEKHVQNEANSHVAQGQIDKLTVPNQAEGYGSQGQIDKLAVQNQAEGYGSQGQIDKLAVQNQAEGYGSQGQIDKLGVQTQAEGYGSQGEIDKLNVQNQASFGSQGQIGKFGDETKLEDSESHGSFGSGIVSGGNGGGTSGSGGTSFIGGQGGGFGGINSSGTLIGIVSGATKPNSHGFRADGPTDAQTASGISGVSSQQFGVGFSGSNPPLMYFPGEQKPSIFSGASHSSSAHQSSSSQQSSSSSSQSGHRFVVGGNRFGNLHSGGLLGLSQVSKPSLTSLGNFGSLGSVSAVHHSSSSSSSSSASQSHNSASHHSTSYGFGLGNTNNKDKSKPEIGQLQFNREFVGNPEYQQSQGGLLKSIGNNKEDGKEYQQSQFGQLQSPAGSVDQQQSQFGQIETIGKLPSQNAVGIAGHEGGYQNEGSGTNHHEKAPNLPGGSGRDYGGGDSSWRRRWNSFTSWGANLADKVAGGAREFGGAVARSATGLWNKAGNTFQGVWSRFKNLLKGFSDSIHKGATYCAHVLQERADDVRSSQFMQKLEDKFEEGNQQVMGFFTVLGDKISKWSDQHANEGIIDDGFTGGDQHDARTQQLQDHFKREDFPDFFQDSQVQGEIEKLVDSGIIQQEEADLLVKKGRP